MNKEDLLFYNEYESFYEMAEKSIAFRAFCVDAFGEDFSQDGFSDISQVDLILPFISNGVGTRVLDIGCGNGKMLRYLQRKTSCSIYGFDFSENAINTANSYIDENSEYRVGVIGEIEYPENYFDVITSMDTIYFAKDMTEFIRQAMRWLKNNGTLFIAYQEGDVMPKTAHEHTTRLAEAFRENDIKYTVTDITRQTYEMLKKKRTAALKYENEFIKEGNEEWFDMLMWQTECVTEGYELFSTKMARYIYIVKKD